MILVGCGNQEDGIPFRAPQGSNPLPEEFEARADAFYAKTSAQHAQTLNSSSSRAIRRETIGINVDIRYKDQERSKADVTVTLSFAETADSCSQAIYRSYDVNTTIFSRPDSKFMIEDFGEAKCFRFNSSTKKCDYLYLTMTQTPSSVVSSTGLVRGAVPVILKNIQGTDSYIPTIADNDSLLQVPAYANDFQYCLKPVQTIQSAADVIFMIDSTSLIGNDDDFDLPYNYIGNGFF